MRIDPKKIREYLLTLEEGTSRAEYVTGKSDGVIAKAMDDPAQYEHFYYMCEKGLLEANISDTLGGSASIAAKHLTAAGHDLVEVLRNEDVISCMETIKRGNKALDELSKFSDHIVSLATKGMQLLGLI